MKKKSTILPFALTFLVSCTTLNLEDEDTNSKDFLDKYRQQLGSPSLSAGVVLADGIVWQGNSGSKAKGEAVTEHTMYSLASVSKLVTLTAAMILWQEGTLNLDEDISHTLGFIIRNPRYPSTPITARMLMQHTSSIHDRFLFYLSNYTIFSGGGDHKKPLSDLVNGYFSPTGKHYQRNNFLHAEPGSTYEYSNLAIALLGRLVEIKSQQPFDVFCQKRIFTPLGMHSTSWFLSDLNSADIARPYYLGGFRNHYGYPDYPAGQLRSTVADLARFLTLWTNNGKSNNTQVLTPQSVDLALTIDNPPTGLMWHENTLLGDGFIGHTGGDPGVATVVILNREVSYALIMLSNRGWRKSDVYEQLFKDLQLIAEQELKKSLSISHSSLEAFKPHS